MLGDILLKIGAVAFMVFFFGFCIFIHELGHFLAAKKMGVQVNEFWIGMGPTILKHEYHGTMYCLKLLPVGGACVMEGEDGESESKHAFGGAPLRRRSRRADEFSHRLCHPAVRGTGADR